MEDQMRIRKSVLAIAAGAMLAAAGGAYATPLDRDDFEGRNFRSGAAMERRGEALIRQGEQLERRGDWRRGEALERQGRQLKERGERMERSGRSVERWEH